MGADTFVVIIRTINPNSFGNDYKYNYRAVVRQGSLPEDQEDLTRFLGDHITHSLEQAVIWGLNCYTEHGIMHYVKFDNFAA